MNETLLRQGRIAAQMITAASRKARGNETFPCVVDDYVAFYAGDSRFQLSETTILYIRVYLADFTDETDGLRLTDAVKDDSHVRELIEIITS